MFLTKITSFSMKGFLKILQKVIPLHFLMINFFDFSNVFYFCVLFQ